MLYEVQSIDRFLATMIRMEDFTGVMGGVPRHEPAYDEVRSIRLAE